ncbi:GNAT family N-acetyltransferase [Streptomyces sp. NPDC001312]|uniref:GNAT family N-acetyltransferase n=1 Tax=Streptomyces sp. NPDC001312 TaxID=3364561 RepID=UPI003681ED28
MTTAVWFLGPEQPEAYAQGGTRVQLKDFTEGPGQAPGVPVHEDKQLPQGPGFAEFAEQIAGDGFAFLHEQMRAGAVSPVLTVLHDGLMAGAIGPMETMADAGGAARLLPQYFGVLSRYRGHGYGRALWRAATHWGHQRSAAYQLLQSEVGGAFDRLCAAEELASLGFVNQSGGLTWPVRRCARAAPGGPPSRRSWVTLAATSSCTPGGPRS